MNKQTCPTVSEAIAAAKALRKSMRLSCWFFLIFIGVGIALAFYQPIALLGLLLVMICLGNWSDKYTDPHRAILQDFARSKNWFELPKTELREVPGYYRRKRFYTIPCLIPIDQIVARLLSGDSLARDAPPSGEVQRSRPSRRNSSSVHAISGTRPPRGSNDSLRNSTFHKPASDLPKAERYSTQDIDRHRQHEREEKERLREQERARAEEERLREQEMARAEEERIQEQERVRVEEEQRLERERQLAEEEERRLEEQRRILEAPRFDVLANEGWIGPLSVKAIWRMLQDGDVTLDDYATENEAGTIDQLRELPELMMLFTELTIVNSVVQRMQYKRSQKEKEECIQFHGTTCDVCGFSFEIEFGKIGEGYIEVHHLKPVADFAHLSFRTVNPISDLRPVCANCHRMLHVKNPPLSIEELKKIRSQQLS